MKKFVVKKAISCLVLCLFIHVIASAQTIIGKVTDEHNLPVEFANIVLLSPQDSTFIQGTVSRQDGSFQIAATSQHTYIIKVSSIGYHTIYQNVRAGETVTVLLPGDAVMLSDRYHCQTSRLSDKRRKPHHTH